MKFNDVLKVLGGNFYKIFYCKTENSFNQNELKELDLFGLLIETKKGRKFISSVGQVSGWDGLFLCDEKISTEENSVYLVKKEGENRVVYMLDYEYYTMDNANMAPLIKQYNHCSYKIKQVAMPENISNHYIEKEVEDMGGIDSLQFIDDFKGN